jgi:hypothetical protein
VEDLFPTNNSNNLSADNLSIPNLVFASGPCGWGGVRIRNVFPREAHSRNACLDGTRLGRSPRINHFHSSCAVDWSVD